MKREVWHASKRCGCCSVRTRCRTISVCMCVSYKRVECTHEGKLPFLTRMQIVSLLVEQLDQSRTRMATAQSQTGKNGLQSFWFSTISQDEPCVPLLGRAT